MACPLFIISMSCIFHCHAMWHNSICYRPCCKVALYFLPLLRDKTGPIILCMRSANERRRYSVTSSLIAGHKHKMTPDPEWLIISLMISHGRASHTHLCREHVSPIYSFSQTALFNHNLYKGDSNQAFQLWRQLQMVGMGLRCQL